MDVVQCIFCDNLHKQSITIDFTKKNMTNFDNDKNWEEW